MSYLAVDAVYCELVSGGVFPGYREFTGNIGDFSRLEIESVVNTGLFSISCEQIPCILEQRIQFG